MQTSSLGVSTMEANIWLLHVGVVTVLAFYINLGFGVAFIGIEVVSIMIFGFAACLFGAIVNKADKVAVNFWTPNYMEKAVWKKSPFKSRSL